MRQLNNKKVLGTECNVMSLRNISKNLPFIKTEDRQSPCHINTYDKASTEPPDIKIMMKSNNDEHIFFLIVHVLHVS